MLEKIVIPWCSDYSVHINIHICTLSYTHKLYVLNWTGISISKTNCDRPFNYVRDLLRYHLLMHTMDHFTTTCGGRWGIAATPYAHHYWLIGKMILWCRHDIICSVSMYSQVPRAPVVFRTNLKWKSTRYTSRLFRSSTKSVTKQYSAMTTKQLNVPSEMESLLAQSKFAIIQRTLWQNVRIRDRGSPTEKRI